MYIGLHVKYLLFLFYIKETWIFSTDFEKYSNIMKIRSVGAEFFYADRRMDRTKPIVDFAILRTRLKIAKFRRLRSLQDTEREARSFSQESDSHYSAKNWNGSSVQISRQGPRISFLHNH